VTLQVTTRRNAAFKPAAEARDEDGERTSARRLEGSPAVVPLRILPGPTTHTLLFSLVMWCLHLVTATAAASLLSIHMRPVCRLALGCLLPVQQACLVWTPLVLLLQLPN
jgi:hypothetical protein